MTPLLQQFLSESRDVLQDVGEKLIQLEDSPANAAMMGELFRLVHTLKGNCGLFDFPEMARVLHAGEDLMALVRDSSLAYSQMVADRLLDAMDFVGMLLDEIEASGTTNASHAAASVELAQALRQLITPPAAAADSHIASVAPIQDPTPGGAATAYESLFRVPDAMRRTWQQQAEPSVQMHWISYVPEAECFFKGEDPFFQARQTPAVVWQRVNAPVPWPALAQLDAYRCVLGFEMISFAQRQDIEEHFRYVPEQVTIVEVTSAMLARSLNSVATATIALGKPGVALGIAEGGSALDAIVGAQREILGLPDAVQWLPGRLKSVAATLTACCQSIGRQELLSHLDTSLAIGLAQLSSRPLLAWLDAQWLGPTVLNHGISIPVSVPAVEPINDVASAANMEPRLGRRAEDSPSGSKTLKVDQEKVDRLMSLIGEMVVAKNGLPYLASRAETVFGVRELAREIKTQYAVINRIAEEMQDAIMQVRMMPVSFVFQRFPRLVRDISRKLGKEVHLVLEGEETEADKNIIEALADPLIHIVRNSLDHGFELPDVRRAAGKPAEGRLLIRASQESDRVVIDIIDDGRGIDPVVIKRKAYEKGIIDEVRLECISDQDAVNLVFAAGFSTADVVSDLSGRGVGMDVVRSAVEQVNGTVTLDSKPGEGTRLRLSLPLSMAVTNVMIVESDKQIFGVPMDMVVETVRVPRAAIHTIKDQQTTVLRGRIVPLRPLNALLAGNQPQRANAQDELATLVVRLHGEHVGIVVDDFREVMDIILKPMTGILGGMSGYAGSALMGDGSVLMVLNPKELV